MIPRKTLKRKIPAMSVEKAAAIFKSMSVLHAKQKFQCYKGGYRFLLALAYDNASHISSLQMNNRALAKAIQREKENTATQLNEKILAESRYFDLLKEYSILKTKVSTFEKSLTHIDDSVKTSMIPNLVRLSDDITTLKMNCDVLRNAVNTNEPDTTTRIYPKNAAERNPRIACNANIPSPVTEESGCDETFILSARKCKGGLRNAFNISNRDRRMRRSLTYNANIDSSFTELNSAPENQSAQSSGVEQRSVIPPELESSQVYPDSPGIALVTSSPRVPTASPAVALRRVLTPINTTYTTDLNESVHSTTEISFKEKSPSIIEEDISRILPRSEYKRSAHSSFFRHGDDSGVTERKRPKQSHLFKGNGENKSSKKSETFKTSSHNLNVSSRASDGENCLIENVQLRRSKSRRKSSRGSFCENEVAPQNYSLIGERKRYRTRSESRKSVVDQSIDESSNKSESKAEENLSIPNTNFGNETTMESSLNDSRRLRTRSRNVCYKERPLNVKLRKN